MLTRVLLIGTGRINEAAITLSFDHNLNPRPDLTYIITPYPRRIIDEVFDQFGLNSDNYCFLDDTYFKQYYNLSKWEAGHWYLQQAFKLCAIDHFDSDYFLIQDCDQTPLKPFDFFVDNKINLKVEVLWNPYQQIYSDMVEKLIGMRATINYSLVNELMPVAKQDWINLKTLIEQRNNKPWLDAIPDIRNFSEEKWFSEFELLGTYKTHQDNWTYYVAVPQAAINTWEDFYSIDWSKQDTIKYLTQPLKFMKLTEAQNVIKHLKSFDI